jgi:hypothetical protein
MGETISRCHCTLPLTVPLVHVRIWYTDRDPDPGPWVSTVVRWGDEPHLRRWVRRTGNDTDKWDQKGILVDGFHERVDGRGPGRAHPRRDRGSVPSHKPSFCSVPTKGIMSAEPWFLSARPGFRLSSTNRGAPC